MKHFQKARFALFLSLMSGLLILPVTQLWAQTEAEAVAAIQSVMQKTQPMMSISSITPSPIEGLYEIGLGDGQVIFASSDAKYFIPGDLYEALPSGLVNRGEQKRNLVRADKIDAISESEMIIFDATIEEKATLTVFTDVDCPYCRKFHGEIERLNELGVRVRYLAFPREGLDTPTYAKMISTWCADDPKSIMTSAKRGGEIPAITCDDPVAKHYQLGREVGVTGTPALVLENGTILPGYVPADELAGYLFDTP